MSSLYLFAGLLVETFAEFKALLLLKQTYADLKHEIYAENDQIHYRTLRYLFHVKYVMNTKYFIWQNMLMQ